MTGKFTLLRRGGSYVFDESNVGKESEDGRNLLGYVPNRAIMVRKIR